MTEAEGAAAGQVSILLVDDHPAGLLALEEALAPLGQRLVKAESGREALRQVLRQEFAVILLDVLMPELDGFETARLIRERRGCEGVPLIFLTALAEGELPQFRAYSMGAVDYVLKPFHPHILRSKVSVFVELAKRTQLLRRSNEQLREANHRIMQQQLQVLQAEKLASVGLLAAGVAHEINNPLMGAINCLSLLRQGRAPADRREVYFDAVAEALQHIATTVRALLGYAREQPVGRSRVDLTGLVSSCLPLLEPVVRARGVDIVQRHEARPLYACANGSQLRQAAMNVLLNAVHASPAAGKVTVSYLSAGSRVGICFEDEGEGMAPEVLQRVCDPFFTTKPQGEGTGLGLSVTQGIIHAHGGELAIRSELGQGTAVTLWLPAPPPEALPSDATSGVEQIL